MAAPRTSTVRSASIHIADEIPTPSKLRAYLAIELEAFPQLLTRFHKQQMDQGINIDPTVASEDQIEEHERVAIRLKRTRNFPVELVISPARDPWMHFLLECRSVWSVLRVVGPYNFLHVCHH